MIAMLPAIPPLPTLTAFQLDKGQFDQVHLRWGESSNVSCLRMAATLLSIVILLPVPIFVLLPLLDKELSWFGVPLVAWAAMSFVWYAFSLLVVVAPWAGADASLSSLTLDEDYLTHIRAHADPEAEPEKWDRQRLVAVYLDEEYGRQRLLLDDGRQIEIAEDLSNADREWLAEVIRAWIPPLRFTPDSPVSEGPSESIQQG